MKTVSFKSVVAASSQKVLVARRISHPYSLETISARFAQGCNNLLELSFYISPDDDASTSKEPNGLSILRDYGQVDYVVGNDDTKNMRNNIEVQESGSYLKVMAVNKDTFEHTIDVQMEIEITEG